MREVVILIFPEAPLVKIPRIPARDQILHDLPQLGTFLEGPEIRKKIHQVLLLYDDVSVLFAELAQGVMQLHGFPPLPAIRSTCSHYSSF